MSALTPRQIQAAQDMVRDLGHAMACLTLFDTGRNPAHLMVNDDTGASLGLVVQGRENVESLLPILEAWLDDVMPKRIETVNEP